MSNNKLPLDEIKNFKAPPEKVKEAKKHFRKPTKKELAEAEKYTKNLLSMFGTGARLTQEESELALAVRNETLYKNMFDSGNPSVLTGLVNCLITQGRFEEALRLCPARSNELNELINARDRDDTDRCNCPSQAIENKNVPSEYIVKKLWHPAKKQFCWLVKCNVCGEMNLVSNLHEEIRTYHASRMDAIHRSRK